jgi:hypothetical protein
VLYPGTVVEYYNKKVAKLESTITELKAAHAAEIEELLRPDGRFVIKSVEQYSSLFSST